MHNIGRTQNTNGIATVLKMTADSVTPIILVPANPDRMFFRVDLDPGAIDIDVYIRLYDAAQDVLGRGILLQRQTFANSNIFNLFWEMPPDNIYTGEISAITLLGIADVDVTEY